ncbi:MAG: S9 family peptidase [Tissierellia bacterium]|nr:S9 family peptidase [Tissierellia bacterium]
MSILKEVINMNNSSSGKYLNENSFLFLNNSSGTNQIWYQKINGEKKQITFLDDKVWDYTIHPNGKDIVFMADIDGNENTQIYYIKDFRNPSDDSLVNLTENNSARYQIGGITTDGNTLIYTSNERNAANFDICSLDLSTGKKSIIIENSDNYNHPAGLSPNGKYLVVNKLKSMTDNFLWLANLETTEFIKVLDEANSAFCESPAWLSDSSGFYFTTDFNSEFKYLAFYDIANNRVKKLYETNWDINKVSLSSDDKYLAITINENGYTRLSFFNTENMNLLNTPQPPKGVIENFPLNWSEKDHKLLFTLTSGSRPQDLWTIDLDSDSIMKMTESEVGVEIKEQLVEPTLRHFISFDGLEIPYWYYRSNSNNRAVVINIHGGPESQSKLVFNATTQELLAQGIDVIKPNVRGSVGYGKKYHLLDNVEKRLDSVKDISFLASSIIEENLVDPDKIAVMGASYGGFMTLASMAFYPKLWAAGIDIVGIANFETFLKNTSDYRRSNRESEYGTLANDLDTLRRVSPIHKIDEIIAPLMVIHGVNDPRVPLSEAEQVINSLESRNVPVKSLIYPDEGHGISKKKNQIDAYPKMVAFLKEHLKIK